MFYQIPNFKEKLLSASMYLGVYIPLFSWFPLIWLIVINVRRMSVKDFIKYHCYQAILFNMLAFFLPQIFSLLIDFIGNILSFMVIFENTIALLNSMKDLVLVGYFILIKIIAIYGIIWTLRGKFAYIPPISQAVNLLLR